MRVVMPFSIAGCVLMMACGGVGPRATGSTSAGGGGAGAPQTPAPIAPGVWGGDHVTMNVTESGARLQFDCATGAIDVPVAAGTNGQFDLAGTFTRERPGAQRVGDTPAAAHARYRGALTGSTMTIEIVLTPSNESVGTFTMERGAQGRVFRCR